MWRPRRADADFSSEIQAHIALETDRLIGEGVSPAEARLAARRAFGSVAAAEDRFYESARVMWLDHLRQDLLGVGAVTGLTFTDTPASAHTFKPAVLSRRVWLVLFGDKPEAIGSTIWVDGDPHTIAGVMPQPFWFAETGATIWIPLEPARL